MPPLIIGLISPAGRLRRRGWWGLQIAITLSNIVLAQVVLLLLAATSALTLYSWLPIIQLACSLPFLWPGFVIGVKRLHDLGRSAFWITPFYLYYFWDAGTKIYFALHGAMQGVLRPANASWYQQQAPVYAQWLYTVAIIVIFGLLPGQKRVNRFGAPAGKPAPAADVFD